MVGVLRAYSNTEVPKIILNDLDFRHQPERTLREQAEGSAVWEPAASDSAEHQGRLRVTEALRGLVCERYEAGATTSQIAGELAIGKTTVLKIVGDAGLVRPRNKLTEADIAEAGRLRAEGWLFREIGEKLGVHKDAVRKRLLGP